MTEIHPNAVVDSRADLADGCKIGPYCVVGAEVSLGEDCVLRHHVSLAGPAKIGPRNEFYPFASVGHRSQDLKYKGEPTYLEIGEGNCFREFCTVNRGTAPEAVTRIGSHCNFLAYSHVAHDCDVRDHVIFSNNGTLAGHVIVEENAIVGGFAAVHQFCRIGQYAMLGGCTKIVQDVPPFLIADGNPAEIRGVNVVGLERSGFGAEVIRSLREAFRLLYRANLNTTQALEAIEVELEPSPELLAMIGFVKASKRGIVR